jgi:hypothetical protein
MGHMSAAAKVEAMQSVGSRSAFSNRVPKESQSERPNGRKAFVSY